MSPFYQRLPEVAGIGVERTADVFGAALAIGATAGVVAHAAATGVHQVRARRKLPVMNESTAPTAPSTGAPRPGGTDGQD